MFACSLLVANNAEDTLMHPLGMELGVRGEGAGKADPPIAVWRG